MRARAVPACLQACRGLGSSAAAPKSRIQARGIATAGLDRAGAGRAVGEPAAEKGHTARTAGNHLLLSSGSIGCSACLGPVRVEGIILDKDGTFVDSEHGWRRWVNAMARNLAELCDAPGGGSGDGATAPSGPGMLASGIPGFGSGVAPSPLAVLREPEPVRWLFGEVGFDPATGRVAPPLATQPWPALLGIVTQARLRCAAAAHESPADAAAAVAQWHAQQMEELAVDTPREIGSPARVFGELGELGVVLAINTSDGEAETLSQLEALQLSAAVECWVCGDHGLPPKPSGASATALCAKLGLRPEAVWMVGDSAADTGCARAAGLGGVVGVLSGTCDEPACFEANAAGAPADVYLRDIKSLPELVRANHARFDATPATATAAAGNADNDDEDDGTADSTAHTPAAGDVGGWRLPGLLGRMWPPVSRGLQPEYDYVVVGAGSAGCVLANELSADGTKEVLLLEAGGWDWNPLIHIPAGVYSVFKDPSINWNMETEPEPGCAGRRIELPRGRVLGGSSSINAMVYMRGHPNDYDGWARHHALPGWDYAHCLPYFQRGETSDRGSSAYRGGEGRLSVTRGAMENELYEAMLTAGDQSGQGVSEDLSGFKPEGVARLDRTASPAGRRCSAAEAHLVPALRRPNLHVVTGQSVARVEIADGAAVGVELVGGGTVHARGEVVLSTGTIMSPQLLMLSGVGPAAHLAEHGIECVKHLPGVGQNLQDHACINTAYMCTSATASASLAHLAHPVHKLDAGLRWMLGLQSPATSNVWEAGGLVFGERYHAALRDAGPDGPGPGRTEAIGAIDGYASPNLQYHFAPIFSVYRGGRALELLPGFQMQIDQLRPHSRGAVRLRSASPTDTPAVTFNYLSDPRDVAELVDGYRAAQELLGQPAFDRFRGELALPELALTSDAEIARFVRGTSGTDYHPCGTCRMGGDEDDAGVVVDAELRVRGVDRLRVVDASVMPAVVSGNLNAPTQMIALRAADMIRGVAPPPPERPRFHFDPMARLL